MSTLTKSLGETLTLSSGLTRLVNFNRDLTESLTLTEGLYKLWSRSVGDSITLTEAMVARLGIGMIVGDVLTLADSQQHAATYRRFAGEQLSLVDLPVARQVTYNRLLQELASNPDAVIIVRDAWNIIKRTIVPEMYQLENWVKVFEFMELFGNEYNRALGFSDALPSLTSIPTAPAHLVPNLLRLIGRKIDPTKTLVEQRRELEATSRVYKAMGRTRTIERQVNIIKPTANAFIDFPDDEVIRWSDAPPGGWSVDWVWGDRLQYNHHVARLSIAVSIADLEALIEPFIPAGVHLIVNIADTVIVEIPFVGEAVGEEEIDGILDDPLGEDDAVRYLGPDTLFMGDTDWHMGDSDKFISDEGNVNRQPFDLFSVGTLHIYLGEHLTTEDEATGSL